MPGDDRKNSLGGGTNNASSAVGRFAIPSPAWRRQRCPSCSEQGSLSPDLLLSTSASSDTMTEEEDNTNRLSIMTNKRNRTKSVCGRIAEDVAIGTIKYFCRSRGHGFIVPDDDNGDESGDSPGSGEELFLHISDIEGEFVPRKGDRVSYRLCPIPPRFDRFQAVHVHIVDFTQEKHKRWSDDAAGDNEGEEEEEMGELDRSLPYDV